MDRFINDIKKYYNYTIYSAKLELKAEVSNSYLNWVWWVLEPLCFMIIYAFIFGVVFDSKEKHFLIFIFIGITAWDFFNRNIKQSIKIVKKNTFLNNCIYYSRFDVSNLKETSIRIEISDLSYQELENMSPLDKIEYILENYDYLFLCL